MNSLISPQWAADKLDCKRGHVYKLTRDGKLAAIKFGPRMVRINEKELERYKATKCKSSGDLDGTEDRSVQSQGKETIDTALSSMKKTRRVQRVLSGN